MSIERFLVKGRGIDTTPSREQGPAKRAPTWANMVTGGKTKDDHPSETTTKVTEIIPPPMINNLEAANHEKNKQKETKKQEPSKIKVSTDTFSSDEEDDDDEDDGFITVLSQGQEQHKDKQAHSRRFVLNMELEHSNDPKNTLKQSAKLFNKMLKTMQSYLHFRGVPGKVTLIEQTTKCRKH
jgi:hypothetical protein